MSWTTTLVIAHAPSEFPLELRSALMSEGRRCLTWSSDTALPAGFKDADLVLVMPGLAAPDQKTSPLPRPGENALVLALSAGAASWADAALHPEMPIKSIVDRVGALVRLRTLEWECEQRNKTLAGLGASRLDERLPKPPPAIRALHIGGPNPEFAHLQETLTRNAIELRPVLRPSLALDEIESGLVDAVLLDASVAPQVVRELSIILRRNSDLALSPVLVLDPKPSDQRIARAPSLITDIIRTRGDAQLVVVRLKQLVAETRRRRLALSLLRRARARERHDPRTGLSTFTLINAHLATHLEAQAQSGRALAAGLVRTLPAKGALTPAEAQLVAEQVGGLVARLIRAEDMAAQVSQDAIALLFPATLESAAQSAMKRIAAVIGATRFHSPRDVDGIAVGVEWMALQPHIGQTGSELWEASESRSSAHDRHGV